MNRKPKGVFLSKEQETPKRRESLIQTVLTALIHFEPTIGDAHVVIDALSFTTQLASHTQTSP